MKHWGAIIPQNGFIGHNPRMIIDDDNSLPIGIFDSRGQFLGESLTAADVQLVDH